MSTSYQEAGFLVKLNFNFRLGFFCVNPFAALPVPFGVWLASGVPVAGVVGNGCLPAPGNGTLILPPAPTPGVDGVLSLCTAVPI
jgi:hypothetical protein